MRCRMILAACVLAFMAVPVSAAAPVDVSMGIYGGFLPRMGGNLHSYAQSSLLGVTNGVDGINRSMAGTVDTDTIGPLFGAMGGLELKVVVLDYLLFRVAANYARSVYGGEGRTLDPADNVTRVRYAVSLYDFPFTLGFSIPFWKDVRISLSGGIAVAYASYSNSFKSATVNSSADFSGIAYPTVIILAGEHFFNNNVSVNAALSYYRGSTEILESGSDYASIDLSGYRWQIGFSLLLNTGGGTDMPVPERIQ